MTELSTDEARSLRRLAGLIIPASTRHGVPGADDSAIFAEILRTLGRDLPNARSTIARLDGMAGGVFADIDASRAWEIAQQLRDAGGMDLTHTVRVIAACYYRDDRVVTALGMELRPPFPKGHVVEQGDWSLLDPVRARGPVYRPVE